MSEDGSRRWCFTLNNPEGEDDPESWLWGSGSAAYCCFGFEVGDSDTPHWQGFARFKKMMRLSALKKLSRKCHWEKAKGTESQNRDYCSKDGEFFEFGAAANPGARTDLLSIKKKIKDGVKQRELLDDDELAASFARYGGYIDRLYDCLAPRPAKRSLVCWYLWGATATGKTHRVYTQYGSACYRILGHPSHPWDSYRGEPAVCFDEFTDGWALQDMDGYLEGYPQELPCRYHNKWAEWRVVIVLSNCDINDWYKLMPGALRDAFQRRIENVVWVNDKDTVIKLPSL